MSIDSLNDHITSTVLNAAQKSIPRGCRENYKPFWNNDLEKATKAKNEARNNLEKNDNLENRIAYKKAIAKSKLVTKESKKEAWTTKCGDLNLRQGGREAWTLLNNLSGEKRKGKP